MFKFITSYRLAGLRNFMLIVNQIQLKQFTAEMHLYGSDLVKGFRQKIESTPSVLEIQFMVMLILNKRGIKVKLEDFIQNA